MNNNLNEMEIGRLQDMFDYAREEAHKAATAEYDRIGDSGACGFAWVSIYGIKGNTKLGKKLKKIGVTQDYRRIFEMWNPSGLHVQSIQVLEVGAARAAKVLREFGFDASASSRLD